MILRSLSDAGTRLNFYWQLPMLPTYVGLFRGGIGLFCGDLGLFCGDLGHKGTSAFARTPP